MIGAETVSEAIHLRREMQKLFKKRGYKVKKWKWNEMDVLASIPEDLKDQKTRQEVHL